MISTRSGIFIRILFQPYIISMNPCLKKLPKTICHIISISLMEYSSLLPSPRRLSILAQPYLNGRFFTDA